MSMDFSRAGSSADVWTPPKAPGFRRLLSWSSNALWYAFWSLTAVLIGFVFIVATVFLPPTGAFGIVLAEGLVLLWVMPDLRAVPMNSVKVLFFIMVAVVICVPNYYTFQVSQLPWISIRRISIFPVIVLFSVAFSGSSAARAYVLEVLMSAKFITYSAIGFFIAIWLSCLTSIDVSTTMSNGLDAALSWFTPWLVAAYVIRTETDVRKVMKLICYSGIVVCAIGISDFILQRRVVLDFIPSFMLDNLIQNNDSVARMVTDSEFRNGLYRASSIFGVSLCFGEFAAMVAPLGAFFAVYSQKLSERIFGLFVVGICAVGVFTSGARGGYLSIMIALTSFATFWCIRTYRMKKHSMAPILIAAFALMTVSLLVGAVMGTTKGHNLVMGGGMESYSTDARFEQWSMSIPKFLANPITGHGFELGAIIIGNGSSDRGYTIDSYILSLFVETGIIGFVSFTTMMFACIIMGVFRFIGDPGPTGPMSGALGCSIAAFTVYRTVLSQHENHTLAFIVVALLMTSAAAHRRDQAASRARSAVSAIEISSADEPATEDVSPAGGS